MLALVLVPAALVGLTYLFCYGGFEGPIDWAMGTTPHGSRDRRTVALTFDDGPALGFELTTVSALGA